MVLERSIEEGAAALPPPMSEEEYARKFFRSKAIYIDPIMLENDEIRYELTLRNQNAGGTNRERCVRLINLFTAESRTNEVDELKMVCEELILKFLVRIEDAARGKGARPKDTQPNTTRHMARSNNDAHVTEQLIDLTIPDTANFQTVQELEQRQLSNAANDEFRERGSRTNESRLISEANLTFPTMSAWGHTRENTSSSGGLPANQSLNQFLAIPDGMRSEGNQRNVRFQLDEANGQNRESLNREIFDTPRPQAAQIENAFAGQTGRQSDVSNRSDPFSTFSIPSNFSDSVWGNNNADSTRIPPSDHSHSNHNIDPIDRSHVHNDTVALASNTYMIDNQRGGEVPQGQWVWLPAVCSGSANQVPSLNGPGRFVFVPYDEPNAWRVLLNTERQLNDIRQAQAAENAMRNLTVGSNTSTRNSTGTCDSERNMPRRSVSNMSGLTEPGERQFWPQYQPMYQPRLKPTPVHLWKISFSGDEKPTELTLVLCVHQEVHELGGIRRNVTSSFSLSVSPKRCTR